MGNYSLLFRVDSRYSKESGFSIDNISIVSCDYPSSQLSPNNYFLSFSCNFDNSTMCGIRNDYTFSKPTYNFTVFTGDTIRNKMLGPIRDHTKNSISGGFLYWNRVLPFGPRDLGMINIPNTFQQNSGMCIKFAYYVNSSAVNSNGTQLSLTSGGCYAAKLWSKLLDDSQGWQTVVQPVNKYACAEMFYFSVVQYNVLEVSVAFDDIEINQCNRFISTTSTPPTTTITGQSSMSLTTTMKSTNNMLNRSSIHSLPTTVISTYTASRKSSSSQSTSFITSTVTTSSNHMDSTKLSSTTSSLTTSSLTAAQTNACRILFSNGYSLLVLFILSEITRENFIA